MKLEIIVFYVINNLLWLGLSFLAFKLVDKYYAFFVPNDVEAKMTYRDFEEKRGLYSPKGLIYNVADFLSLAFAFLFLLFMGNIVFYMVKLIFYIVFSNYANSVLIMEKDSYCTATIFIFALPAIVYLPLLIRLQYLKSGLNTRNVILYLNARQYKTKELGYSVKFYRLLIKFVLIMVMLFVVFFSNTFVVVYADSLFVGSTLADMSILKNGDIQKFVLNDELVTKSGKRYSLKGFEEINFIINN